MREDHDLVSATREPVGKRVRGSLDAATLQPRNRQAVAERRNPKAGHAGWHAQVRQGWAGSSGREGSAIVEPRRLTTLDSTS